MAFVSKAHKSAWAAHDAAFETLIAFWNGLKDRNHGSKLSVDEVNALCNLLERFDACQERIRIHRNKPLPDTARRYPQTATRKEQRHALKRASELAERMRVKPMPAKVTSPPPQTPPPSTEVRVPDATKDFFPQGVDLISGPPLEEESQTEE